MCFGDKPPSGGAWGADARLLADFWAPISQEDRRMLRLLREGLPVRLHRRLEATKTRVSVVGRVLVLREGEAPTLHCAAREGRYLAPGGAETTRFESRGSITDTADMIASTRVKRQHY